MQQILDAISSGSATAADLVMPVPTEGAVLPLASVEFVLDAALLKTGDCVPRLVMAVSALREEATAPTSLRRKLV
mgnify:CR=1 FL=1